MKNLIIFTIGGIGYALLEILWRGYTHISMILTGGLCFLGIYYISLFFENISLLKKSLLSSLYITALEFTAGFIVNIKLKFNVWDYSELPFNLNGQICFLFSFLWFLLSLVLIFILDLIQKKTK